MSSTEMSAEERMTYERKQAKKAAKRAAAAVAEASQTVEIIVPQNVETFAPTSTGITRD